MVRNRVGKNLVVLGAIRNGSSEIERSIKKILIAARSFHKISFFVVESDSIDDTKYILSNMKRKGFPITFESLGNLERTLPSRTERIAYCRNVAKKLLEDSAESKNYDYALVADLDGVNRHLTRNALDSCWDYDDWQVATANQPRGYYDVYALRHPVWCPNDCWEEKHTLTPLVGDKNATKISVLNRMIQIPSNRKPIRVDSAFGGLAIYSREFFESVNYRGKLENGKDVCEHVPPNLEISKNGGKILIMPSLVNIPSLAYSHPIGSYKWLRLLKEENRAKFH